MLSYSSLFCSNNSLILSLNILLTDKSKGRSKEVVPGGMSKISILFFLNKLMI